MLPITVIILLIAYCCFFYYRSNKILSKLKELRDRSIERDKRFWYLLDNLSCYNEQSMELELASLKKEQAEDKKINESLTIFGK